ncbi:MAG TPA: TOBE domain-containing protein [Puia sp.]|jgi:molybdopterin-binding protein
MNVVYGEIIDVASETDLSLVRVLAHGQTFHAIVIDTPATSPYLKKGHPVQLLFKETEVIIARQGPLQISVRNQVPCRIERITAGKLLCELALGWSGIPLRSIITRTACEALDLKVDDPVIALIKTNEVSLSPHLAPSP